MLVYLLWYVVISLGDFFSLSDKRLYYSGMALWFITITAILAANSYYIQNSLFGGIFRESLGDQLGSDVRLKFLLIVTGAICLLAFALAMVNLCYQLTKRQYLTRDSMMLSFLVFISIFYSCQSSPSYSIISGATEEKPNIFIIGFDALRPDYLSFFNQHRQPTPHFDNFLSSSIVFKDAYTPEARTLSSWVSVLTGQFPLHTGAREDNVDIASIKNDITLTSILKNSGYNTLFISDDNRFSNINNKAYGFEQTFGSPGNINDYLLCGLADFPLSNLIASTKLGQLLFPDFYANHAIPFLYQPEQFMQVINAALRHQENKPLFLAVHFNITAWPYYYLADHQPYGASTISNYKNVIAMADKQLDQLLVMLGKRGLLDHAIFVLMSDHGITLGLPGDRVVSEAGFQGRQYEMKLQRTPYSDVIFGVGKRLPSSAEDEVKFISIGKTDLLQDKKKYDDAMRVAADPRNPALYGIDTTWGYGTDLLSLKQNQHLLAFRIYNKGLNKVIPHQVSGVASLLDITPTLLDRLHITSQLKTDGISLQPYLVDQARHLARDRTLFFESAFTSSGMHDKLSIPKLLAGTISYFEVNPENGLVFIKPAAFNVLIKSKQRAILKGDWLLVYYPESVRTSAVRDTSLQNTYHFKEYMFPPYVVLANVKSGKWTTNLQDTFAVSAPLKSLKQELYAFYGKEMLDKTYFINDRE